MERILAIDLGERRVGLALSDERRLLAAEALETLDLKELKNQASLEEEIGRLSREHGVGEVVVGLPLNMDGSAGEAAQKAARFAESLSRLTGLPVHTWDERLTTVAARRVQRELNLPLKKRRDKKRLDRTAALILLQNYLNYRSSAGFPGEGGKKQE